jgi:hypothetical protein
MVDLPFFGVRPKIVDHGVGHSGTRAGNVVDNAEVQLYVFGVNYYEKQFNERADQNNAINRKLRVLLIRADALAKLSGKPSATEKKRVRALQSPNDTRNLYWEFRFNDLVRLKTLIDEFNRNKGRSFALVGDVFITVPK